MSYVQARTQACRGIISFAGGLPLKAESIKLDVHTMPMGIELLSILSFTLPFILTYLMTDLSIRILETRGWTVKDFHKSGDVQVPRPGGPAVIVPILVTETLLYILTQDQKVLALTLTTTIAFLIGFTDDIHTLGGVLKPCLLVAAALPILMLEGVYSPNPVFPLFGSVRLTVIYPLLILAAIPITANTVNTIDVLNGVVSGFMAIVAVPLLITSILKSDVETALASMPLISASIAFYLYHRYPSKIFPGDSGTLAMGAMYGALAIVGGLEIVGIVALLPAILNSFLFLSSVKKLVEHRRVKIRPVEMLEDYRLTAVKDPSAPITLVRLILAEGPLGEREVANCILKLAVFSTLLATVTAFMTWR